MNQLACMIVAAFTFIQFRNPETDALLFVTETVRNAETGQDEQVFKLDANGQKMPIGVKVYGPGSKQYRREFSKIQTANIQRGKKGLTGETLRQNETDLLSKTTFEWVNFTYEPLAAGGAAVETLSCSPENNAKLYDDGRYIAVREQVAAEQGDLGNFAKASSTI